ncbi:MAG: bifunctional metallophosphatase/5'-nucleotidase, partial [Myxococcaceae bacterium]
MSFRLTFILLFAGSACAVHNDAGRAREDAPDAGQSVAPLPLEVTVVAFNDFHGQLTPPGGGVVVSADGGSDGGALIATALGGAEYLARHIRAFKRANPHTVVVSAGDLFGASPLLSALVHDEPTVEVMNALGLDVNAVGNHEFDDGAAELLRMQRGGCHPIDGCGDAGVFAGARFQMLAANVATGDGGTLFPRYTLKTFDEVKIAFLGMTLEGTPGLVTPDGIRGLHFQDEAETVNALVPELRSQGVRAIVVIVHEGGVPAAGAGMNECRGLSGPIVEIARTLDSEVDVIVSGHTHQIYNCELFGKRVTSAQSQGRLFTEIRMQLDRGTGDVLRTVAANRLVTRDAGVDEEVKALVEGYASRVAPLANRVVGVAQPGLTLSQNAAGEMPMGQLIADAQLAATTSAGAQLAFMNPGGVRTDFPNGGEIRYGQLFDVQPFGNSLVTMTLSGQQIAALLEQQWVGQPFGPRILQISEGFHYTWWAGADGGMRIERDSLRLGGQLLRLDGTYRVTVNSYLAGGGDGFGVLLSGNERVGG